MVRRPRWQAGQPSRGVDAALAAVATLTASWPISTLLAEPTWLRAPVLLLAVIALTGAGARWLGVRGWQVLVAQVTFSVLGVSAIYGRGHLWHGLPTFETLGLADRLVNDAVATAQAYAAPAPTTPGLSFVVGCALVLTALAVDYLAVTRRSPALAGLPLLAAFLASAANRGSSLPIHFFLAVAAMWLILVARASNAFLLGWGTTAVAMARTPTSQSVPSRGAARYSSMARLLGATALVAAVAVPVVLPKSAPTFLTSGLGRSSSVFGGRSDVVGVSLSLDLAADLASRSTTPVLQYTTADTSPPPLRVSVSDFYRSEHGVWLPWGRPLPAMFPNPDVPEPIGLSAEVPRKTFTMTVRSNLLDDPSLAAPYPLIDADLAGVSWGADPATQSVRVAQRPDSYTASYWRLEPTATMLRGGRSLDASDRDPFVSDLSVDGPYRARVTALAELVTTGAISPYDQAIAIQQYLRASGGFTYSLTLAPAANDGLGKDAGFDPLTNFLVTKQGYCVQFASAMTMMSRALGIPARVAIGFLPGTLAKGVWSVTASDAHAWPELYLDGIGWTRFEPTPSRAAPPPYAIPAASPATSADGRPLDRSTVPAPRTTARRDLGDPAAGGGTSQEVSWSLGSALRSLTHGWGLVLLGSLIAVLGSLIVPSAALWRRRHSLATARTPAQRVEVHWDLLTSSLGDLGIAPAPSRTPRQQRTYYDKEASLEGLDSQALGRVVQTLELSRYAVTAPDSAGLPSDARQVRQAVAATRGRKERVRAALWPSGGIAQLSSVKAELTVRIRVSLREAWTMVRERLRARP